MSKKYLITGVTGSGKSSICRKLVAMGYESYDIEDMEGMFAMYRKGTKEIFDDFDNSDPEKIKNSEWLCDVDKLKELLARQEKEVAFYCGVASNMDDLISLFDRVILLKASPDVLYKRLASREGTDDMGATEESRQAVLGWKDWWENEMEEKGAIALSADGSLDEVAETVIFSSIKMNNEEKGKIIARIVARVQTGLFVIDEYLRLQNSRNSNGPDTAWLRSLYIILSFHFEILLKSRLIAIGSFKDKEDLDNKLKKVGHNVKAIGAELGEGELRKINIETISLIDVDGEYIIKTADKTIYIKDFNDIRYDFIEGKVRNIKRDENSRISESVEGVRNILKKIIAENKAEGVDLIYPKIN